jgi:hypothetical protein
MVFMRFCFLQNYALTLLLNLFPKRNKRNLCLVPELNWIKLDEIKLDK